MVDKNSLLVHSRQEAHPQKINPYLALQTSKNTAIIFSYLHSGQKTIKDKLHPRHSFFCVGRSILGWTIIKDTWIHGYMDTWRSKIVCKCIIGWWSLIFFKICSFSQFSNFGLFWVYFLAPTAPGVSNFLAMELNLSQPILRCQPA